MIDIKELRIGNIIKVDSKGTFWEKGNIIEEFTKDTIYFQGNCGAHVRDCKPLPLTPEILEKAGFVNSNDKVLGQILWRYPSPARTVLYWNEQHRGYITGVNDYNGGYIHFTVFKHLHQLQNFYFAFTGKEVDIKGTL